VTPLEITGLTIFILVLIAGIFSTLLGLPGTIIILVDAILYALFTGFEKIGIKVLIVLFFISLLAEALDFALSMAGTARYGASKKSLLASLIGGIAGAIVMTPVLLGFGTLLGSFLGGYIGVLIVELIRQGTLKPALRAGSVIIAGWFTGMFVKGSFALVMTVITLTNIYS
jgi:uncharacterized protein